MKTIEANQTSQFSLKEAERAVDQAKRANDIAERNIEISERSSRSDDSINSVELELTRKLIGAQINSVNESQKQFVKINMPYLQFDEFSILQIEENTQLKIQYRASNLGNFPAKILDRRVAYLFSKFNPTFPIKNINFDEVSNSFNIYINKENPVKEVFTSSEVVSKKFLDSFKSNDLNLFFFGDIVYENELNGKRRIFSFCIKKSYPLTTEYKIIYNKNIDIR